MRFRGPGLCVYVKPRRVGTAGRPESAEHAAGQRDRARGRAALHADRLRAVGDDARPLHRRDHCLHLGQIPLPPALQQRLREYVQRSDYLYYESGYQDPIKSFSLLLQAELAWTCNEQWLSKVPAESTTPPTAKKTRPRPIGSLQPPHHSPAASRRAFAPCCRGESNHCARH